MDVDRKPMINVKRLQKGNCKEKRYKGMKQDV